VLEAKQWLLSELRRRMHGPPAAVAGGLSRAEKKLEDAVWTSCRQARSCGSCR